MKYFDPQTLGLLDDGTHQIPIRAKPLTSEQYQQIKIDLAAGKQLRAAGDGTPLLDDPEMPTAEEMLEMIRQRRISAYRNESDPLKMEAEHDAILAGTEPDYTAWLAKVAEIKERYPLLV